MDMQSVLGQNPPNHTIPTLFLFGIRNTKEASKPFEDQTYFRSDAQCFRNRFGPFLLIRNTQTRWVPFGHGVLFGIKDTSTLSIPFWKLCLFGPKAQQP